MATVERKHREAAIETWWTGGDTPLKRAMTSSLEPWLVSGDTTAIAAGSPHANLVKVLVRIACLHALIEQSRRDALNEVCDSLDEWSEDENPALDTETTMREALSSVVEHVTEMIDPSWTKKAGDDV